MKQISNSWNKDFYDENPEYNLITFFKEFKKREPNASQILWGIYLLEHPRSPLYKIKDKALRKAEIDKNYFNIDWDNNSDVIDEFISINLTDNQKFYRTWLNKARELDKYLEELDVTSEADKVMKLFDKAKGIWGTLDEIKRRVEEDENSNVTIKGQGQLSARDKRNA